MFGELLAFILHVLLFTIFAIVISFLICVFYRKMFPPPTCTVCTERERTERMQAAMLPKPASSTNVSASNAVESQIAEESDVDD